MTAFDVRNADDEALLTHLLSPVLGPERAEGAAGDLLARFGSLAATLAASIPETRRVLGPERERCAEQLAGMQQLLLSVLRTNIAHRPLLSSSPAVRNYLSASLAHEPREQFRVLHLDGRLHLIVDDLMATGTVDHAAVYPREVLRRALELGAKSLILVHNHPGGNPRPSGPDVRMTELIAAACKPLEMEVVDHLIVARHGIFSLRESTLGPWAPPVPSERRRLPLRRVASS